MNKKMIGTKDRPRVVVDKSNKYIFVQAVDDVKGLTMLSMRGLKNSAEKTGTEFGKLIIDKKIKKIVFDRNGYIYHGRIKTLADALRKAGLEF